MVKYADLPSAWEAIRADLEQNGMTIAHFVAAVMEWRAAHQDQAGGGNACAEQTNMKSGGKQ